jgi:hypothetical protein
VTPGGGLGQKRQLLARLLANTNASLAAQIHQPIQAIVLPFARHLNMVKVPLAGLERLLDGMHAVKNFHKG